MPVFFNASAAPYVAGTLTAATFRGAPMVVFADGLASTQDPRWTAALAFAEALGARAGYAAPIIGVETNTQADRDVVLAALARQTNFYAPDERRPLWWASGLSPAAPRVWPVAGPFLSFPSTQAVRAANLDTTWDQTQHYVRSRSSNLYGIGTFAVGKITGEARVDRLTPPAYNVSPKIVNGRSPYLTVLLNLWHGVWNLTKPMTLANYQALAALEGTRPGISLVVHPALVPLIKLS